MAVDADVFEQFKPFRKVTMLPTILLNRNNDSG
jgi:hypothetical protein